MASAGMLTVTNSFENKTADALSEISPNLITATPDVESIARALVTASEGSRDFQRRAKGGRVAWSQEWNTSFDDAVMARVAAFLAG